MTVCMDEPTKRVTKVRLSFTCDERVRRALKLAAAKANMEMFELAEEILSDALEQELREIENPPPRPKGKRRGS